MDTLVSELKDAAQWQLRNKPDPDTDTPGAKLICSADLSEAALEQFIDEINRIKAHRQIVADVFHKGFETCYIYDAEEKFVFSRVARRVGPSVEQAARAMAMMVAGPGVALTHAEANQRQLSLDRAMGFTPIDFSNPEVGDRLMHFRMRKGL